MKNRYSDRVLSFLSISKNTKLYALTLVLLVKKIKSFRRPEKEFLKVIRELIKQSPDILILHEGPDYPQGNLVGKESIRKELEKINLTDNLLVICGHSYWKIPMIALENGIQVIKADSRVIVLQAKK